MVSTPPSLLQERVNAKHTGVMSKQSCPPPPLCYQDPWWAQQLLSTPKLFKALQWLINTT